MENPAFSNKKLSTYDTFCLLVVTTFEFRAAYSYMCYY